jgi:hypothetical protein
MTVTATAEDRHAEHMKRVRAVQRRSWYGRVLQRIAKMEHWEHMAEEGLGPPLLEHERAGLLALYEQRDQLVQQMRAEGQEP